jgi:thioredoxin-related protein
VNFADQAIAGKARRHFDSVAINIWGDREVTWIDGRTYPEKSLAAMLKVQFTPTLLFLDEQGRTVLRVNGYYPPHRFAAALDYVAGRHETKSSFTEYLARNVREEASGRLHDEPFFRRPPHDLSRTRGSTKPLAVLFEQKVCAACDELHATAFKRASIRSLVQKFDVVRLELFGQERVVAPDGLATTAEAWARALDVAYTPGIVFFVRGREVFRVEGYLRPFHIESSLAYVASGGYTTEPSFQRYVQQRAEKIRQAGGKVEIW